MNLIALNWGALGSVKNTDAQGATQKPVKCEHFTFPQWSLPKASVTKKTRVCAQAAGLEIDVPTGQNTGLSW